MLSLNREVDKVLSGLEILSKVFDQQSAFMVSKMIQQVWVFVCVCVCARLFGTEAIPVFPESINCHKPQTNTRFSTFPVCIAKSWIEYKQQMKPNCVMLLYRVSKVYAGPPEDTKYCSSSSFRCYLPSFITDITELCTKHHIPKHDLCPSCERLIKAVAWDSYFTRLSLL